MKSKVLGATLLAVVLILSGIWGVKWVGYRLSHAVSNAAFVESDSLVNLAYKRVGGRVVKLYKKEGERVKRGEILAKLEDRELSLKIAQLRHQISALEREKEALIVERERQREELDKRLSVIDSRVAQAQSRIEALEAEIAQLDKDWSRFKELYSKGVVPARRFEEIDTGKKRLLKEREAALRLKESLLRQREVIEVSYKALTSLEKRIEALQERRLSLLKRLEDLEDMLKETELRAPFDGVVVKEFLKEGEVVRPGQYVYSLLNPEDVYILVLLEENKLEGVKEGNRVYIKVDALPHEDYEGVVSVINMATASKFALIPRDITAGEFTKVAQRVPIRIEITKGKRELLRVGFGAEVAIEKR